MFLEGAGEEDQHLETMVLWPLQGQKTEYVCLPTRRVGSIGRFVSYSLLRKKCPQIRSVLSALKIGPDWQLTQIGLQRCDLSRTLCRISLRMFALFQKSRVLFVSGYTPVWSMLGSKRPKCYVLSAPKFIFVPVGQICTVFYGTLKTTTTGKHRILVQIFLTGLLSEPKNRKIC